MNFVKFPVASTAIFPIANSTTGGQLLTESNQLSRETVANHSNIPYVCGPSYTHSLNDFLISGNGGHILYISGGVAIVHGHFVQLNNSSNQAISIELSGTGLSGELCVGLRAVYNNPNTAAATLKIENGESFYEGIQVVVLPKAQFRLPENNGSGRYTPRDQVNAHLKLGEFSFINNVISNVQPYDQRHACLDADKIANIEDIMTNVYVKRDNLNPNKLYVMSGKGNMEANYWADATGDLMIWDANPQLRQKTDTVESIWLKDGDVSGNILLEEAAFRYDNSDNQLKLVLPHKQVDNTSTNGTDTYYVPKTIPIPAANRASGEGGVLNSSWVNFLNGLDSKIATMYRMPGGKMRKFIDVLSSKDALPKPPIGYYTEQTRSAAYYDNRLQYSFNLLQTQVAQLNNKFIDFQNKLESEWKAAVTADVSASFSEQNSITQQNVDDLKKTLADFQGDLAALTADITSSGDTLVTNYETYYQSLAADVAELKNRWMSLTPAESGSQDQQQNDAIEELREAVAKLTTTIKTIDTKTSQQVSEVYSTLNTLYQSLYGANTDGSAGDVKDATASIEQLRSQYDYLYDAIHDLYDGITAEVEKATATAYSSMLAQLSSKVESEIASLAEQYNVSANWAPGDYVLVAQDQTITSQVSDTVTFPSTMYVVVPGMTPVDSKYVASYYDVFTTDLSTPINRITSTSGTSAKDIYSDAMDTYQAAVDTIKRQVPTKFVYGYELGGNDVQELTSEADLPDVYNSTAMLDELYNSSVLIEGVRGTPGKDYFVLRYRYPTGEIKNSYTDEISGESYADIQCEVYRWVSVFFTLNLVNDKVELDVDNPIILSGGTPYAEDARVGGFLNVGSDVYGYGYVSRDDEGHLRLNDFELLAAGVSAYQLGEDRTEGSGLDISELQDVFDQYVNQRIAFPNDNQLYRASEKNLRTDVITIDLNIGETSEGTLNIYDIDSRFNTSVHLNITGSATENVVLNIVNCQRLRISMDPTSHPTILLDNVCLYYDADILDRISQIKNLSLWYYQFEDTDPQLEIDGMTVIYQGKLDPKGTNNFWTRASGNDNSYAYALRQITFASDGTIIGMGVAVTDNTTTNIVPNGESIFASTFTLPQAIGLSYPVTRLTKQIKVTGNFITSYLSKSGSTTGYIVKNTNFTILTQKYLKYTDVREFIDGVISFYTKTSFVADATGVEQGTLTALNNEFAIDGWESGAYHIFYGGAIE